MNRERIEHKRQAWDEGEWVRDAARAHADKERARRTARKTA